VEGIRIVGRERRMGEKEDGGRGGERESMGEGGDKAERVGIEEWQSVRRCGIEKISGGKGDGE